MVEVLVGRHPLEHLVANRVVEVFAGVEVGDPGRELLNRDICQGFKRIVGRRNLTFADLVHACPFEFDGVDGLGEDHVVAHGNGVAAFFGRPATAPGAPCPVWPEHVVDVSEVVRQVVFGEQVDVQRAASRPIEGGELGNPVFGEVQLDAECPWRGLMREPFFGRSHMPVHQLFDGGF